MSGPRQRVLGALAAALACLVAAQSRAGEPTAVPDVIAQQAGLRLRPMSPAARFYAMNCQGCHGNLGVSVAEIPPLAGRMGYFVRIPEGRRYLIELPNIAMNPGSNEEIAAVLNWALYTYSRAQLPASFEPYTAAEVGQWRKQRIDVSARRRQVIERLLALGQIPSGQVLALSASAGY